MRRDRNHVFRLTLAAVFSALVVVFQLVSYFVKIGPFGITVTLVPVVLGAALLGAGGGALLGGVFGVVVSLCSVFGLDSGGNLLFGVNPFLTVLVCLVKGLAAGLVAGLVFGALSKKKHVGLGAVLASASAPIVNTSLFCVFMFLFFRDTLAQWAGGTDLLFYVITGLVGWNFLIEFSINLVLSPIILAVINAVNKSRKIFE